MNFQKLIENLKQIVFIAVPISLAMTYVGVFSFYINYNIDITTYLGFEDLTIIYSKYTIISFLYILIIYLFLRKLFRGNGKENYWDKTIYSTSFKRRIIPMSFILIAMIVIIYFLEEYRIYLFIIFLALFILSLLELSFYNLFFIFSNSSYEKEENFISIIALLIFGFSLIPFLIGYHSKEFKNKESIILYMENNKTIDVQKGSNLEFIGKTSSYIFILDNINNKTIVLPIDKIIQIEYCNMK